MFQVNLGVYTIDSLELSVMNLNGMSRSIESMLEDHTKLIRNRVPCGTYTVFRVALSEERCSAIMSELETSTKRRDRYINRMKQLSRIAADNTIALNQTSTRYNV
jgi:hypothetical protein